MSTLRENPVIGRSSSVDEMVDATHAALALLRDLPDLEETFDLPEDAEAEGWIREVWTDQGGTLRTRKSLPKGASDEARCLSGILRWHQSGGDLTGLMIARFNGRDAFDRIDTLAEVLRLLGGAGRSRAVEAWRRTGIVG